MTETLLGDCSFAREPFPDVERVIGALGAEGDNSEGDLFHRVSSALLGLIQQAPSASFLLPAVIDFIERLEGVLPCYGLLDFELWLNQFSGLNAEGNERVRAKIVGKCVPRDDYQVYFPIGMGKRYSGSHYVTAHNPPDLDTTVASFWGWVDAFGARISKNLHIWNLPGGELPAQAESLFRQLFGPSVCRVLPRADVELTVTALDLVRQRGLERHTGEALTSEIDHGRYDKLVVLVDEGGYYQGCWRSVDVEKYRLATLLIRNAWQWFEHRMHAGLLELFARPELESYSVKEFVQETLHHPFEGAELLSDEHAGILDRLLHRVLGVTEGIAGHFLALVQSLEKLGMSAFTALKEKLENLDSSALFDRGVLTEDRSILFRTLADLQGTWAEALTAFRHYLDRLDVALQIKHDVFAGEVHYVFPEATLDEMRGALGPFQFLPVVRETEHGLLPIGVVHAAELSKRTIGTATLRDFCNREEVKVPANIDVISVVDHHRSQLQTTTAPTALVGDVQSCNVLLAEQAFILNDRYGFGGVDPDAAPSFDCPHLVQRHAQRQLAQATRGHYFIHPKREFAEYLSFLYAILDDTDLLSRVSARDVLCVATLVNRMKSIVCGQDRLHIAFDGILRGPNFAKLAARRILDNQDMYSLYGTIYARREYEVAADLVRCVEGERSAVFADTKEQKGCARVGQTKIFPKNFPTFVEHSGRFRQLWLEKAQEIHRNRPELELHIQMITTIPGAEEVYQGSKEGYSHRDELWIWVPQTDEACDRLEQYLKSFISAPEVARLSMEVALLGPGAHLLHPLFQTHLSTGTVQIAEEPSLKGAIAVLRFDPAAITSRKLVITPAIPV